MILLLASIEASRPMTGPEIFAVTTCLSVFAAAFVIIGTAFWTIMKK
jgi:hypothetical protein